MQKLFEETIEETIEETYKEKQCVRCKEFWPADSEFFYKCHTNSDGLHSWCKACCTERTFQLRHGFPLKIKRVLKGVKRGPNKEI